MTKTSFTRVGLTILSLVLPAVARADAQRGLGTWQGSGSVLEADGHESGGFTVVVARTAVDARTVETRGTVTLANGTTRPVYQRMTMSDQGPGFRIESDHGQGGGYCFGNGMCQSYEEAADGSGFATTIVVDGPDKLRILVTQLEHGKAVRFIEQRLTRKP